MKNTEYKMNGMGWGIVLSAKEAQDVLEDFTRL